MTDKKKDVRVVELDEETQAKLLDILEGAKIGDIIGTDAEGENEEYGVEITDYELEAVCLSIVGHLADRFNHIKLGLGYDTDGYEMIQMEFTK